MDILNLDVHVPVLVLQTIIWCGLNAHSLLIRDYQNKNTKSNAQSYHNYSLDSYLTGNGIINGDKFGRVQGFQTMQIPSKHPEILVALNQKKTIKKLDLFTRCS